MNLTQAVNNSLKAFRRDVPDCIGVGVVDISTGMLLAVDTADKHPSEILDMLAAATADLFQGKTVTQIEEAWKHIRGSADERHYFQEILVNSDNLVHLFMRSKANPDLVAAVVCSRDVNIGMLFAQGRQVMKSLDAAR
jgi:hypothetical protein